MSRVTVHYVPRHRVIEIWPILYKGILTYREKTPHEVGTPQEILENLMSSDGDELLLMALDARYYAGFGTFKVIAVEGEIWGTFATIFADERASRKAPVLEEAMLLARDYFRKRGCTHMNYFTARKGFRRLAPKLGFKERIIEFVTEVS